MHFPFFRNWRRGRVYLAVDSDSKAAIRSYIYCCGGGVGVCAVRLGRDRSECERVRQLVQYMFSLCHRGRRAAAPGHDNVIYGSGCTNDRMYIFRTVCTTVGWCQIGELNMRFRIKYRIPKEHRWQISENRARPPAGGRAVNVGVTSFEPRARSHARACSVSG
eukprot:COSAG02_NODE_32297_length_518_cov_1.568019_1_plen_163_part_00